MGRNGGAARLFETGRWLARLAEKAPVPDMTLRLLSSLTGIPEKKCRLSLRTYRVFKDNPRLLENLTVKDAKKIAGEEFP